MASLWTDAVAFLSGPPTDVAPTLTAAFLLAFPPWTQGFVRGGADDFVRRVYRVALLLAIAAGEVGHDWRLWAIITGLHFAYTLCIYAIADNHRYLEGYWCLTLMLGLAIGGVQGDDLIRRNATALIGLCFLIAVLAKLGSTGFRNGSFFSRTLIEDDRFLFMALTFGRMTVSQRKAHNEARQRLLSTAATEVSVVVPNTLRRVAIGLTWWTLMIEAVVAVVFLWPSEALVGWRVLVLTLFVLTTYLFVPVDAFGTVLLLMLVLGTNNPDLRVAVATIALALSVVTFVPTRISERAQATTRKAIAPFATVARTEAHPGGP
jgi:hypothetical protein